MTYLPPEDAAEPQTAPAVAQPAPFAPPPRRPVRPIRRRRAPVTLLKIALPLTAVVTVGYLFYWWLESRETTVDPTLMQGVEQQSTPNEVTVTDVKYDGKDDQGRPFSITAESAAHEEGNERRIALKKPLADIVMGGGAYVAVTATDGLLDRDADIVTLTGDVTLFHDNGLSFQTDSATIDLKAKTAEGSDPVEGQNEDGEVIAQGFKVLDDGNTIEFTGKAYMKIYPKKKGQDG